MEVTALITGLCGAIFAHAMLRLWRNRETPGATACLLLFAAVAVYVPSVLLPQPSLPLSQIGFLAGAMLPPLMLIAATEYAGLEVTGWSLLRHLLLGGVSALGLVTVLTEQSAFQSIATAPDAASRSELIRAARHGPFLATTLTGYVLGAAILAVSVHSMLRSPARRRDMTILMLVAAVVIVVDVAHYVSNFTIAGLMPTPLATVVGTLTATLLLYRSNMFDLRPIARSMLIESVKDAVMVVDDRHRILDVNLAAAELLGRPRTALIGQPAGERLPREFSAMLQSTVHLRSELAAHLNDGQRTWFEVDVTPLDVRGRRAGHLLVARNISERRVAQAALEDSRRALEAANERLVEQSVTDPLTGLKNRRFLFQRLDEEMNRQQRSGSLLGLLVVDLDHFKAVNDTHGHPVGDDALIQVAAILQDTVRDCDVVARLGGEEFAVIAVNTDAPGLINLAERIRAAISSAPVARHTARPMILTVSIGVACAGPDSCGADGLFARADGYLYEAKRQGRNRVVAALPHARAQHAG